MSNPQVAPYGSWKSPLTAEVVFGEAVSPSFLSIDADNIYWVESRPQEKGRSVIVRRSPDCQIRDCIPGDFNARTRVHEYGGRAYLVDHDLIYFSNFKDQRLYRQEIGGEPDPYHSRRGSALCGWCTGSKAIETDHRPGRPHRSR